MNREESNSNLQWQCTCKTGILLFDHEKEEVACNSCGLVIERVRRLGVDHGTQTEQYQPTLASSFNKGLGSSQPEALICWIIKHAGNKRNRKLSPYKVRAQLFKLRKYVSTKDADAKLNAIRQHLTRRIQEIKGFDPSSDKDTQFVTLDELGRFLCRARGSLGTYRFSANKLVDALLVHALGEDARAVIERPRKHLRCPGCRTQTAYAPDRGNRLVLCVECGKAIPLERAKFKVTYTPIEQKYAKTIERILADARTIDLATPLTQPEKTPILQEAQ